MGPSNSGVSSADIVNLQDVVEIVEIINAHTDEDQLIDAVLQKMLGYEMAAFVVMRRLSDDGTTLEPVYVKEGGSPLEELMQTQSIPLDSFEGHALAVDHVVELTDTIIPRVKLDPTYVEQVWECAAHGATGALFYPVRSTEAIGTLSFYSYENVTLDESGVAMFQRGAKLLAFGVEKCRRIAAKRGQEAELESANLRLESSNRDLQDFAHVASHDLQEPLRKIRTFGERLQGSAADRLTQQSVGDLEQIQDAAMRMQRLIDELLVYSRVGNRAATPAVVGLNAVLDEVLAANAGALRSAGAVVEVGPLPAALVDERQMVQLFSALIDNAMKFAASDRPLTVLVSGELADGTVTVEVEDNGIGFDPEHAERLFEPFRRLHPPEQHNGTGMGLAVVRRIITRHSGTVTAVGEPDRGATFRLRLPAAQSA